MGRIELIIVFDGTTYIPKQEAKVFFSDFNLNPRPCKRVKINLRERFPLSMLRRWSPFTSPARHDPEDEDRLFAWFSQ